MFGHVPLQGEHYVRVDLVMNGAFDLERPSVLMFSPVRGVPTLVGVAYAFMHPAGAPPPAGFDGAGDVWHAHERLATTPGKHLVMMHAWFVDAAGGAFARYNEALPYLAAGLTPPAAEVLADSAAGRAGAAAGFALASAVTRRCSSSGWSARARRSSATAPRGTGPRSTRRRHASPAPSATGSALRAPSS
jgi:hypothetical protein